MPKKLTNEEVIYRLECKNIKILDLYINSRNKNNFLCKINYCNYTWTSITNSVLQAKIGCPQCAGKLLLTNEIIDKRLKINNRPIIRLGNCIGAMKPINWKCTILQCKYEWFASPNNVLNNESGCPQCAKCVKLNNDIIDKRLKDDNRNIIRVGNCQGTDTPILFKCTIHNCKYEWLGRPHDILNCKKSGCPNCAGNARITNEIIDAYLKDKNIIRIGEVIDNKTLIYFQCTIKICNNKWKATPDNIKNNETGCPNCSLGKNEKLVGQTITNHNIKYEQQKWIEDIIASEANKIRVDFYFSQTNTIIEYNGHQHYQPVCFGGIEQDRANINFIKQKERDQYLQTICDQNNIRLIFIDGRKYTNTKLVKYITNEIIPFLKVDNND